MEFWYNETSNLTEKILAYDIIKTIVTTKLTFDEFIRDTSRNSIVLDAIENFLIS